jgi:hypothetical protein
LIDNQLKYLFTTYFYGIIRFKPLNLRDMTKAELKEIINSTHEGDLNTLKGKLTAIIDGVFDAIDTVVSKSFVVGGTGTAAQIAALEAPVKNAIYRVITTGGNLNSGGTQITVAAEDLVYHNGTIWVLFADVNAT